MASLETTIVTTTVSSGAGSLSVAALASIIVLLVVLVVMLVAALVFCYLKVKKLKNKYQPLSNKDGDPLPYPPKIKLDNPPSPLAYTLATPFEPAETAETIARYPFTQHHVPKETKDVGPVRPRVKKRGDHKHARGKNVVIKHGSSSMESDDSDQPHPSSYRCTPSQPRPQTLSPSAHPRPTSSSSTTRRLMFS